MKFFIAHSVGDQGLVDAVAELLRADNHEVFDPASASIAAHALSEITAALRSADVVIAIVTQGNSNVLYELGVAIGAGVATLISAHPGVLLPSHLASVPYVQVTGDRLRDAQTIAQRAGELPTLGSTAIPPGQSASETLSSVLRDRARLESLSPQAFEQLVRSLFEERGFTVTGTSAADQGGDFVIESRKDREIVLVEVKKLNAQGRVSVESVRRLLSALSPQLAPSGMIVSTAGFTAAALALAEETSITLRTLEELLAERSASEQPAAAIRES